MTRPAPSNGPPPVFPALDLKVRKIATPENLWESWGRDRTSLSATLNRTDLPPEVRAYYEDLLEEILRQEEIALHKELRPHVFEDRRKTRLKRDPNE